MVTIKDVAAYCGCSIATVSRVINGGVVSDKASEKVKKAIDALGYTRNLTARTLKTNHSGLIGILVPDFTDIYYLSVIQKAQDILSESGYSAVVCSSSGNKESEKNKLSIFLENGCEAIAVIPSGSSNKHITDIIERGIPVIVIDKSIPDFSTDCINTCKETMLIEDVSEKLAEILMKRLSGDYSDFPLFFSGSGV